MKKLNEDKLAFYRKECANESVLELLHNYRNQKNFLKSCTTNNGIMTINREWFQATEEEIKKRKLTGVIEEEID